MLRILRVFVFVSVAGTVILSLLYQRTSAGIALALAITFGTVAYHFVMRLLVAFGFNFVMHNKADYTKRWYQISKPEKRIYEILQVKKWKNSREVTACIKGNQKRTRYITISPVYLNFMSCTAFFCHYSLNTGNISTTGAR